MATKKPRLNGPKRRTREYAQEHGLTYQQAFQQLGAGVDSAAWHSKLRQLSVPVGAEVQICGDKDYRTRYRVGDEHQWTPFVDSASSCAFIAPHDVSCVGALANQIVANDHLPVESVLVISRTNATDHEETRWLADGARTDGRRWHFQQFVMNSDWAGYRQAAAAADAVAKFRPGPGRLGIVVLQFPDGPHQPSTEEQIQAARDWYESDAEWQQWADDERAATGPFWQETIHTDHPDGQTTARSIKHYLSEQELNGYQRLLAEADQLLRRASRDGIIVLASADSPPHVDRLMDPVGIHRFGARFFNAVRFDYREKPLVNGGELFSKVFPFANFQPEMAVPEQPYFWYGMQPKEGRVAYASFPGLATRPTLLLLKDPPEVPDYWFNSYEQMARQPGAD